MCCVPQWNLVFYIVLLLLLFRHNTGLSQSYTLHSQILSEVQLSAINVLKPRNQTGLTKHGFIWEYGEQEPTIVLPVLKVLQPSTPLLVLPGPKGLFWTGLTSELWKVREMLHGCVSCSGLVSGGRWRRVANGTPAWASCQIKSGLVPTVLWAAMVLARLKVACGSDYLDGPD